MPARLTTLGNQSPVPSDKNNPLTNGPYIPVKMGAVVRSSVASPMGRFLRANTVHEAVIVPREGVGQDVGTSSLSSRLDPEVHTCGGGGGGGGVAVNGRAVLGGTYKGGQSVWRIRPLAVLFRSTALYCSQRRLEAKKGIGHRQGKLNVILCINYLVRL